MAGTPSRMTESAVIAPVGELDLDSIGALAPQLDDAVAADYPRLILDLSAVSVVLYLIDYEQRLLVPVAGPDTEDAAPLSVAGAVAGRAFSATSTLRSSLQGTRATCDGARAGPRDGAGRPRCAAR